MDILYTTTDKIRACIGCDIDDLPDEVVNGQDLDLQMEERLATVYPTHESATGDVVERRLALWCMYFGALTLIEDSVLALAQKIQSNTDQLQRFDVDFEALKNDLRRKLGKLEPLLNTSLAGASHSVMGKAGRGYDVVTGV